MIRILLLALSLLILPLEAKKYPLGLVAIFKNEAPYLREWIEFHRTVGVEHFWLYNNGSTDSYREVLQPYIEKKIIELFDWEPTSNEIVNWNKIQCDCYMAAMKQAKNKARFVAVLDIDEFLFPVHEKSLIAFLKRYSERRIGGIGVNWQMYGTSGIQSIPEGRLLIETLIWKGDEHFGENVHIKSIVRPEAVLDCTNPHSFHFKPGYLQVDTHKVPFSGPKTASVDASLARINHYWTRDEDYFWTRKIPRRAQWGEADFGAIKRAEKLNKVQDTAILRFAPELRRRLGLSP